MARQAVTELAVMMQRMEDGRLFPEGTHDAQGLNRGLGIWHPVGEFLGEIGAYDAYLVGIGLTARAELELDARLDVIGPIVTAIIKSVTRGPGVVEQQCLAILVVGIDLDIPSRRSTERGLDGMRRTKIALSLASAVRHL
jgi:hypothetical protein